MSKLLIVPHQDDEIFCYSFLKEPHDLVIVFKGGGEPKGYTLRPEDLYQARCEETFKTALSMATENVSFLNVERPYTEQELDIAIKEFFKYHKGEYDTVVTTMPVDNHPDHVALSNVVCKHCDDGEIYGFIVQTKILTEYSKKNKADIEIKLSEEDYNEKVKLAQNYKTQGHFLPNVIRRGAYKIERYWRL